MFLPFNKIKALRNLDGSSYVDRKGIDIFSESKGKEHGLMCPTSTLDKKKKLGRKLLGVCVRGCFWQGFEAETQLNVAY
jgi:hypothetical protein